MTVILELSMPKGETMHSGPISQEMNDLITPTACDNICCHGSCAIVSDCASSSREGSVIGAWTLGYVPWKIGKALGRFLDYAFCCRFCCTEVELTLPVPETPAFNFFSQTELTWVKGMGMSHSYELGVCECLVSSGVGVLPAIAGGAIGTAAGITKSTLCAPCTFFSGIEAQERAIKANLEKKENSFYQKFLNQEQKESPAPLDQSRQSRGKSQRRT